MGSAKPAQLSQHSPSHETLATYKSKRLSTLRWRTASVVAKPRDQALRIALAVRTDAAWRALDACLCVRSHRSRAVRHLIQFVCEIAARTHRRGSVQACACARSGPGWLRRAHLRQMCWAGQERKHPAAGPCATLLDRQRARHERTHAAADTCRCSARRCVGWDACQGACPAGRVWSGAFGRCRDGQRTPLL